MDGSGQKNGTNATSRAQLFEDEKKRIVESCFDKRDTDTSLLESYITHIRIVEDGAYPSAPPPPNSNPEGKKSRVVIVAVRKSGRVRMHKARENANGTFSIGKTWPLDELSAVESFSGATTTTIEEEQRKQWAGGVGFTVTLGKPYYWQANTQKEKQFFLSSLVKIYTKYTGGRSPELIGFDERERETLLGAAAAMAARRPPPTTQPPPIAQSTLATPSNYDQGRPPRQISPRDPPLRGQASRDGTLRMQNPGPGPSPNLRSQMPLKPDEANGNLRRLAGNNPSQDSMGKSEGGSSYARSRTGTPVARPVPPPQMPPGLPLALQVAKDPSLQNTAATPPSAALPERRRPPLPIDPPNPLIADPNDNMMPAPLMSPSMRNDIKIPPRSEGRPFTPNADTRSVSSSEPVNASIPKLSEQPSMASFASNQSKATTNSEAESVDTSSINSVPTPHIEPPPEPVVEERPGLGSMIKKKSRGDIAKTFLRAATAANSFRPRAGGAAERLREQSAKATEGPDGITGVVPAPSLSRAPSSTTTVQLKQFSSSSIPQVKTDGPVPEVTVSSPPPETAVVKRDETSNSSTEKIKVREARRTKQASLSERTHKELAHLGIDPSILDGRGADFAAALDEFGWVGDGVHTRNIDEMQTDIEREINKAQAGGWLARLDEEDEKRLAVVDGLEKVMGEIDELDGLLTLYSVELGTLNEDISYIEAQSQGLQVQAANQKLLQAELQSLLGTISISSEQLRPLHEASLESPKGLEQIEDSLVVLFKAMVMIDPSLSISAPRSSEDGSARSAKVGYADSEIGSMRVLQEKKDIYRKESVEFLRRLKPFLQVKFGVAIDETKKALEREKEGTLNRRAGKTKLDPKNHDLARNLLWRYTPLMLFSREIDRVEWEDMMKSYEMVCKPIYQDEFREAMFGWKRTARKATGDEADLLFTSQVEKQTETLATTAARKLTVKRSQGFTKTLKNIGDVGRSNVDKNDGLVSPYEVFGVALEELFPLMVMEQNFVVEFFHVSSLDVQDFTDCVAAASSDRRRGGDLRKPKPMDPNRDLSKKVVQSMEELFSFFPSDMQNLVEWVIQGDPLQGVGVLAVIERKIVECEETNQEYISRTLQTFRTRLLGLFKKFLDEQLRAIEDTKVKIKKRKGVIAFMRIFPQFSAKLEEMLANAEDLEIRDTVNNAYIRINKTMFESLKVIARELPATTTTTSSAMADSEAKEALNYQILLIENMNYYIEEVDSRNNPVLEEWKNKAAAELHEHLSLYIGAVIRRPFKDGKLLDFVESVETQMQNLPPGASPSSIALKNSHSKTKFKERLSEASSSRIRKGIEELKARVEKHFYHTDAKSPVSEALVKKVLDACEKYFELLEERIRNISADVYDGDAAIEWSRIDVTSAFRK